MSNTLLEISSVQGDLVGLWTRDVLEEPTGTVVDTSTRVFWLQTSKYFADIRIPASPPASLKQFSRSNAASVPKPSSEALQYLVRQKGFAGVTSVAPPSTERHSRITWVRHIDFQPQSGLPDIGTGYFVGPQRAVLIEHGVDGDDYKEDWRRLTPANGPHETFAAVLEQDVEGVSGSRGILVGCGEYFLLAVNTLQHLGDGGAETQSVLASVKSHTQLLAAVGEGKDADFWLACLGVEIFLFRIAKASNTEGRSHAQLLLLHSTKPGFQEPALWRDEPAAVDPAPFIGRFTLGDNSILAQTCAVRAPASEFSGNRLWRIEENTYTALPLLSLAP